jgi:lysophospholipase L1-like esterase
LLEDGNLNEALFTDGLHPNAKGYMIIAKSILRLVDR